MSRVALVKVSDSYWPLAQHDIDELGNVAAGEVLMCDVKRNRNVGHHKKGFKLLHLMFDNQDKFDDFETFRDWVQIAAGIVERIIGPEGELYYKIKSLAFDKMDQSEFEKVYNKIVTVAYEKLGQDFALDFVG